MTCPLIEVVQATLDANAAAKETGREILDSEIDDITASGRSLLRVCLQPRLNLTSGRGLATTESLDDDLIAARQVGVGIADAEGTQADDLIGQEKRSVAFLILEQRP